MSYWDETDRILGENGGVGPACPRCGKPMSPADDHGRFVCFCQGLKTLDAVTGCELTPPRIPQVDTTGMTNAQKASIPPINRLNSEVTEAEVRVSALMMRGPEVMDTPEYIEACKALREERRKASQV